MSTHEELDCISRVDNSPPLEQMMLVLPTVNYLLQAEDDGEYELWNLRDGRQVCWRRKKYASSGQWVKIWGWCGRRPLPTEEELQAGERMIRRHDLEVECQQREREREREEEFQQREWYIVQQQHAAIQPQYPKQEESNV